jgi:hypothetical protein
MSAAPPPPGSTPNPDEGDTPRPQIDAEQEQQTRSSQKHSGWIWAAIALVAALGVLAGVIASDNKSKSPSTVVNQQTTSTTNSLGVSVQAPQPTHTTTVTAPTKTVTAPAQTVTSPKPASTTPPATAAPPASAPTSTTPATAP